MTLDASVKEALKLVAYPLVVKDVVSTGIVRQVTATGADVTIDVVLPTMVVEPQAKEAFLRSIAAAAEKVPGVGSVRLDVSVKVAALPAPTDKNRAGGVKNIIAVASGKGGVGKSTVATNLALAMKRWGARVGLLDADVFGPSVPHMLGAPQIPPSGTPDKRISPAVFYDIKVMSVAFFVDKDQAVVWRGPMVHKLLEQFLGDVDWGELDYLVVDLPPGTGDVQLSLTQLIPLTGAVMVTTPQQVALLDVVKAISMFKKVEVPILGVVENMSYYVCPSCGHHDEIFSRGGGRKLAQEIGSAFLGEIPLDSKVRFGGDTGVPVVVGVPDSEHARVFMELAAQVAGRMVGRILSGPRRVAALTTIR